MYQRGRDWTGGVVCAVALALVGSARQGSGAAWAAAIQKSLEEAHAARAEAARQQAGGGSPAPPRRGDRKGRQLAEAPVNGKERDECGPSILAAAALASVDDVW